MEQWTNITGYEGYQISNYGAIKRNDNIRKTTLINGYERIRLSKQGKMRGFLVHRLVYSSFIGEIPAGHHINHIDGDKTNNKLENLEAITPAENNEHYRRSNKYVGSAVNTSKLSENDVRTMRKLYKEGVPTGTIAKKFGVARSSTYRIVSRRAWKHIN